MINYGKQNIDKKDINEVIKSLNQDLLTQGNYLKRLEKYSKNFFKVKYSLACNSGTSAIFLALKAIDVKKGDNIIIPAINFVAASNVSKLLGANIFFCDVCSDTFQSNKKTITDCIKKYNLKKIKAIFSMHLGGVSNYYKEIFSVKKKYNCYLIEDACHALGGEYFSKNQPIGSCIFSDITIFSMHPVKTITSGEGGIITTNNRTLAKKIISLRSHGIDNKKNYFYDVKNHSLNFRISEMNCALGYSQFKKIKKYVHKRRKIAVRYSDNLKKYNDLIKIINFDKQNYSACHLIIIKINFTKLNINYDKFYKILKKKKIFSQLHYIPTYKFSIFSKVNQKKIKLENSEIYCKNCISLPIYFDLKFSDVDYVSEVIIKTLKKYLKI
jgi:dTDP-4-amino-4,6-dideoxygalactose transaminase